MPPVETADLRQAVLVWRATGRYDDLGRELVAAPVELPARWTLRRSHAAGPDGTRVAVDATAAVAADVPVGSRVWLGPAADWYGTGSGSALGDGVNGKEAEVLEVVTAAAATDLKGRHTRRELGLRFHRADPRPT